MRPHFAAVMFSVFALTGAAGQHASRQDIEDCKIEAKRAADDPDIGNQTRADNSDHAAFEAVATCLKSKGYIRVQDLAGLCDDFILPQCFERN